MPDVPESVIHWFLGALVPMGGAFFLFLLKRTFADFETKISSLFSQLEASLKLTQDHETRIRILEDVRNRHNPRKR